MAITPQQAAAKGKGWVDKNNPNYGKAGFVGAEDEDDYQPPGAPPAPAPDPAAPSAPIRAEAPAPGPGPIATFDPSGGTSYVPPPGGAPVPAPTSAPPIAAPPPPMGPLGVDPANPGVATHQPPIDANGGPTPMDPNTEGEPPAAAPDPVTTAYKDALLKMLGGASADPSLSDPTLKAQSEAFGNQQTRAKERARAALAERFAQEGGPGVDSGAFDRELVGMEQAQGEAQGAHDAGLLANELQQRRQQLISAATLAGNQLNADEARSLQRELANIDAEIRKAGLAQQGSQFDRSLGLQQQQLDIASKQWQQQFGLEGQKLAETIRQFDTTTAMGRDQLKQQLEMFKQQMAQQGKQFDVDAELKKLGITTQGALGQGDLDLRRLLGTGQLNLGLLSALMQNQQFGQRLGADLGMFNAGQSDANLRALLAALGQAA